MKIKITQLEGLVQKVLLTKYNLEEALLIKDILMFGELSGKTSHGILRLLKENFGVFTDYKPGKIEYNRKTKISTVIESNGNVGMLVGGYALQEVIKLAKEHDIGIVGTRGSINTTGSLTYYVEKIAMEGLIGVVFTQALPMVSAFGSKKALFGTNPLAFGFPSLPHPLIFDMATAAITFGDIAKAKNQGKPLPPHVAIDDAGNMTTDPIKALKGALLTFDNSYKGSGLAMVVEILASLWSGGSFSGINSQNGWGNLYMAFSPNLLSDTDTFEKNIQALIEKLKNTETRDGKPLRLPGQNMLRVRDENLKREEIEVNKEVITRIKDLI